MSPPVSAHLNDHASELPEIYVPPDQVRANGTEMASPAQPPIKHPWVVTHPSAALTILVGFLLTAQWAGDHYLSDTREPQRQKAEAEIRGIRRDIRTAITYQLEAQRNDAAILSSLAAFHGITSERPRELDEAEAKARKLRDR